MQPHNGNHGAITADAFDALAANLRSVAGYIAEHPAKPAAAPPPKQLFGGRLGKAITDHPFAAVGVAFGFGYLLTRIIRR